MIKKVIREISWAILAVSWHPLPNCFIQGLKLVLIKLIYFEEEENLCGRFGCRENLLNV